MKNMSSPDRQIQRTRQSLLNALIDLIIEKGYEKITVQDIIDRANVGRTTFYAHFQDKQDLLLSGFGTLEYVFEKVSPEARPENAVWVFSLALFRHAEEKRKVFKALYEKQARGVVMDHFEKAFIAYLQDLFQTTFSKKAPTVPLEVFAQYLFSTLLGLLTWWLDNDILYSADQMNAYYRKLTEPTIQLLV